MYFLLDKGTIRTLKIAREQMQFNRAFNSIKVRLEQIKATGAGQLSCFQFHKGTIRTLILNSYCYVKKLSIP